MLKNYLKVTLRNLKQNKFYFAVNVLGLAISMACCIIAFLNHKFDANYDKMHEHVDEVYRVTSVKSTNGMEYGFSPVPLANAVKQDIAEVSKTLDLNSVYITVKSGEQVFNEDVGFADSELSEFFTFPVLHGSLEVLDNPSKIVLTEGKAIKFFGTDDCIGKTLTIYSGDENQKKLTVGAVIADHPKNSSLRRYKFFTHPVNHFESGKKYDNTNWKDLTETTWLRIDDPKDVPSVISQLQKYVPLQNKAREDWKAESFQLQALSQTAHLGRKMNGNYLYAAVPDVAVWGISLMAFLLLITACLNFANTSISFSGKRLKEIGVRKVMGGTKSQLVGQLLGESFAISLIALIVGMMLADWLLPIYNSMWEYLHLELSYLDNPELIIFMIATLIITTLLAGAYPAFYMSSFNANNIFRGSVKFGGSNLFSRVLLGIQVSISLMAIISGFAFAQNADYQEHVDLGYNRSQILGMRFGHEDQAVMKSFKNAVAQNPKIQEIVSTRDHVGHRNWFTEMISKEKKREAVVFSVGKDYMEMMDFKIIEGQGFDRNKKVDLESIIVNQRLADAFGWEHAIGQELYLDSTNYKVVGMVDDFVYGNLFTPRDALAIRMQPEEKHLFLIFKAKQKDLIAVNKDLKKTWSQLFPYKPFRSFYQDDVLAQGLAISKSIKEILAFLALVTLLLTTIGLLALVSLSILKRQKEIAIRKVLGASISNIAILINKHYIWIFLVAAIGGSLLGWVMTDLIVKGIFETYQPFDFNIAWFSSFLLLAVSALIIAYKIFEITKTNPGEILKSEQ